MVFVRFFSFSRYNLVGGGLPWGTEAEAGFVWFYGYRCSESIDCNLRGTPAMPSPQENKALLGDYMY